MTRRLLLVTALVLSLSAIADDIDQDEARRLRESGAILPLSVILQNAARHIQGRLIKTELEHEDGRLVYELEYLQNGQVWELQFDARSGELIGKEKD